MSLKTRIYAVQALVGLSILLVFVVMDRTIRSTSFYLERVEWTNHQLKEITSLTMLANRYSEQIAEMLLIGESEWSDFESARRQLEGSLDNLEENLRDENAFLVANGRAEDERDELHRIERLRQLYSEIDEAALGLFRLRKNGQMDEAIQLFQYNIENRLDAEVENLLTAAIMDEEEEVERTERRAAALWQRSGWILRVTLAGAALVCIVTGSLLVRSVMRPVNLLIAGAEAVGQGDFSHRIPFTRHDEMGLLAGRFNAMAEQLGSQHDLLLAARTDLERQVAARTGELAAANRRLTDLDKLRVQFLADISHELRTPLTALRGEAEITLRHGPKPVDVYEDSLRRIVDQTGEMGRLVDDLLFLARSETDTIRFEPRSLNLLKILAEAVREGDALGRVKDIAIQADWPNTPIIVAADGQRLKQAVMILIDNAIKYSPSGAPVQLRVRELAGAAEIMVRDQGSGIPPEDLPHVFDRFYRGRLSSSPGSGLGLAIAKWLIEKHGGDIDLTTEAGRFTEVRLRLPRIEGMIIGQAPAG